MNTATAAATIAANNTPTDAPARTAPEIDPARVTLNADGFGWRSFLIRLPEGLIADDLKEPRIFRRVQTGRNALRKFDELKLVAYDESWVADATVGLADRSTVVLCKPRKTDLPTSHDQLYQDEKYRIKWDGAFFAVERKADGHVMSRHPTVPEAERALAQLYPRPVQ